MQSSKTNRSSRWALGLTSTLLCAPLLGCVGEIRKGTYQAEISEPDASTDVIDGVPNDPGQTPLADGGVRTNPPGGGQRDATINNGGALEAGVGVADSALPGGPPDASRDAQVPDTGIPVTPGQKPVFVVVGYSGVRLASRDLGKTWVNIVTSGGSGDDNNLLRSAAYGNGLFVAAGWRIWTSSDAITWTEQTNPSRQWVGGLRFAQGMFVGAGGVGTSINSSDGITWKSGKDRNGEHARSVAFGNGMFIAGSDKQNWWSTSNGSDWTVQSSGHATAEVIWCKDKFSDPAACSDPIARNTGHTAFGEGVYVSAGSGFIERSEDGGKTWTKTQDTSANPVMNVAFGYVK